MMKQGNVLFFGLIICSLFGCNNIDSTSSSSYQNQSSNPTTSSSSSSSSSNSIEEKESDLEYELVDDHYEVKGIKTKTNKVYVPNVYQGVKVTKIADKAFESDETVQEVYLSNNLVEIGENAFAYCSNLTHITLENVTIIHKNAFLWNHQLTEINLSDKVTSIGENAFFDTGYYNTQSNWENKILYIESNLVSASSSISGEITIKEGTKLIADNAFNYRTQVSKLMLPLSTEIIGKDAFNYMSSLKYLSVKSSVDVGVYIKGNFKKSILGEFDIYERN